MNTQTRQIKTQIKKRAIHLIDVWQHSDSQPTEITLALVNVLLAPVATLIELGAMPVYQIALIIAGVYQLICVARGDIRCRVRASFFTFGTFATTLIMYVIMKGLATPSHWGWIVLLFAAFGSLKRIKTEQIHRHG